MSALKKHSNCGTRNTKYRSH